MTFVLIGNKSDLAAQYPLVTFRRTVSYQEAGEFAATYGMEFCETSAMQDLNVKLAFSRSAIRIMNKINSDQLTINKDVRGGLD